MSNINNRNPIPHADTHKNDGSDQVATQTPTEFSIPMSGASGEIDPNWVPVMVGDDGENPGQPGLVPAPAAGDADAGKYLKADGTWETPAGGGGGSGDVTGPASSTDNALARFDLTTGKIIQNSSVTVDDSGNLSTPGTVNGRNIASDGSKLDGIETGADVTDASNVAAAGAIMSGASAGGSLAGTFPNPTLASNSVSATQLVDNSVTYAKMQDVSASDRLLGRDTAGSGNPEELTVGGGLEFTGSGGIQRSALTGDVTASAGSNSTTIASGAVTNAKLANVATATIKGRITSGTGSPEDLTSSQATSLLDNFVGDSGSGGTKGLVPSPGAGDAAAGKYLKADGNWDVPAGAGTGDVTGPASATDNAVARFDLTTGKIIQNSSVTIDDSGNIATAGTVDGRDVSADGSKLDGIESGADVTDAANVAAAGAIMSGGSAGGSLSGTYPNPAFASNSVSATQLVDGSVSNAKLANVATATIKGRTTAGTGSPEDLTTSQATALLNNFVGDSGSGGTKGLVPAPAAGDAAAGRFLKADGNWDIPAGGGSGDVTGPASSTDNAVARFDLTTGKIIQNSSVTIDDSGNIATAGTVDGRDVSADGSKLDGIESGADVTDATNVAAAGAIMSGGSAGGSLAGTFPNPTLASNSVSATQLVDGSVSNAKLANVATATIKGRTTSGTGSPEDLTASQATALLNNFVGDSGSGGTKGLVPAPAAGDAAAGRFLKADGNWDIPAGGGSGDVTGPASSTDNAVARFDLTTGKIIQNSSVTIDDSGNIATAGTVDGRDVSADGSKLDGIETGADVTDATNVAAAGAIMSGGSAGGSLSGTYPNPALASNSVSATQLVDGSITTVKIGNQQVSLTKIANITALSALVNATGGSAPPTAVAAASDYQLLRRSPSGIEFGAVNLNSSNAVSNQLPIANGGTGAADATNARTNLGAIGGSTGSTDNRLLRSDGTGTRTLQDSAINVGDNGELDNFRGTVTSLTNTSYTVTSTDSGKILDCSNAGTITFNLPNNIPVGWCVTVVQSGAGVINFTALSGATLRNRQSHTSSAGQWAMATLYVRTNSGGTSAEYVLGGDTA